MNEPNTDDKMTDFPVYQNTDETPVKCKKCSTFLIAIGVGLAVGLAVRALRPKPTPQSKLTHLLEQIEGQLRSKTRPAGEKICKLLSDGTDSLQNRLHKGESQLEHLLRQARRQIQKLLP